MSTETQGSGNNKYRIFNFIFKNTSKYERDFFDVGESLVRWVPLVGVTSERAPLSK